MSIPSRSLPQQGPVPLHTMPLTGGNPVLPLPLTSFIGREEELETVGALLTRDQVRLVTITGPGGVGKTRLAIEVAREADGLFADGVHFVGLAPARDPDLVPAIVAQTLKVPDVTGQRRLERLHEFFKDKHLLLVLDNLEHLPTVGLFVVDLLEHCPELRILGTSRRRLSVSGEQVYPLHPLQADPAMDLFKQRAQALLPDFAVTPELTESVNAVCKRLDGLPLAIELAAARIPVLPPLALLSRLDNRLSLLSEGHRDAPVRHHGMREAIAWSHDLLNPVERVLFRRLGVFVDSFTLDAAGAVAGNGEDVLEGVAALEANSLLQAVPGARGEGRLVMLETIREFAFERLKESGEEEGIHQAHARYYLEISDKTEMIWWLPEGVNWLDRLEAEHQNLRAVFSWLDSIGDTESILRLAGSLGPLWAVRGHAPEGRAWLERGFDKTQDVSIEVLALASRALSWLLHQQGDGPGAVAMAEQALARSRQAQDVPGIILSLIACGVSAERCGDLDNASPFHEQALELLDTLDDALWARTAICLVLVQLGSVAMVQGEVDQAESWYARALEQQQSFGPGFSHNSHPIEGLGDVARAHGDNRLALQRYQAGLRMASSAHNMRGVACAIGGIAGALSTMRQFEIAARLFGASEALHEAIGFPFAMETFDQQRAFGLPEPWGGESTSFGVAQKLRDVLGNQAATVRLTSIDPDLARSMWSAGRELSVDEAVAQALAADAGNVATNTNPGGLSQRELEVLTLLVQGHTDREIASLLFISPRTVANDVRHIYDKLDVSSRAGATAYAFRHGLA